MENLTKEELIKKAHDIPGMVSEYDLDWIYDNCQLYIQEGGSAIEIGGWKGSSSYLIASVCKEKNAVLYELDTFAGVEDPNSRKNQKDNLNGYYEAFTNPEFWRIFKENLKGLPVALLKGDSKENIKVIPDRMVDFAFIDGNHEAPMVDEDIKNCLKKVRTGGLVCGHDHGNPDGDVHGAVDRIFGKDFIVGEVRPLNGDPKFSLTIWNHVVTGNERI